jgi:hypothetical protein
MGSWCFGHEAMRLHVGSATIVIEPTDVARLKVRSRPGAPSGGSSGVGVMSLLIKRTVASSTECAEKWR